jgi:hypothetical protein
VLSLIDYTQQEEGVAGFLTGVAKGLVGAVAAPVAGTSCFQRYILHNASSCSVTRHTVSQAYYL